MEYDPVSVNPPDPDDELQPGLAETKPVPKVLEVFVVVQVPPAPAKAL